MFDVKSIKVGSVMTCSAKFATAVMSTAPKFLTAVINNGVLTLTGIAVGNCHIVVAEDDGGYHIIPVSVTA